MSVKPWVCPANPQCKDWDKTVCKHLRKEIGKVSRGEMPLLSDAAIVEELEVEVEQVNKLEEFLSFLSMFPKLKLNHKRVLSYIYVLNCTREEAAERLGMEVDKVDNIHRQAKKIVKGEFPEV